MRRKRVEIFFILYLMALVAFVFVSKERNKHDEKIEREKERFLKSLLTPVKIEFEKDTLWQYVSTEPGTQRVAYPDVHFRTSMKIFDVGPEDSAKVQINAVTYNNLLVSPRLVVPEGRRAFGDYHDRIVQFPLDCYFSRTGSYTVSVGVHTKRFHGYNASWYRYRDIDIPRQLITGQLLRSVERSVGAFTIIVEDTSISVPVDVPEISVTAKRPDVRSAVGFEEDNEVTVNLGFYNPRMRIVRGYGALERIAKSNREEVYVWHGPVKPYSYMVTIEAKVDRKAGGKDISQTSFTVNPTLPLLTHPLPEHAFSGETFEASVKVQGLDDDERYVWELYEAAGNGSLLAKLSGKGPVVRYHVPTGFDGKQLIVKSLYAGRSYLRMDAGSGRSSSSTFVFTVVDPPVHIEMAPNQTMSATGTYRFTAYKYSAQQYRYDQPVMALEDVAVQVRLSNGKNIPVNVRMNSPGRFEFALVYEGTIPENGQEAILTITVKETKSERVVTLVK